MATLPTTAETIVYADVSVGLCANYNSLGALFGRRVIPPASPMTIAIVTDSLRWASDGGAVDAEQLRQMRNYLLWLIGMFGMEARALVSGGGGGTVVPISGSNPSPIQFIVSASSYIPTGDSTKTVTTFVGFNLLFTRGGITQSTVNTEPSYYTWVVATGAFTCVPAAQEGELFQLYAIS